VIKWPLLLREKVRKEQFGPPMKTDKRGLKTGFLSVFIGVHRRP
jgi:hypothetical protein